eukprot:CAMPEP_0206285454 /NCGR_PEP_ID=MMETSP0106_2-20121207/106_1 /ASSEMBLY_ACC=CAM_ASM_000206 /TAXON_ID=81532 /ORGANISM="Acanthoeca-like sp., Strain 10tr" /LENGTH=553 /DNA_ID=CAMNT_0053715971 /DNA_START=62 /DNA_END=1723 /DNA_ORIENTATION=+
MVHGVALAVYTAWVIVLSPQATSAHFEGTRNELMETPPAPRCKGAQQYSWYATVQHCFDLGPYGNDCQKLNSTLLALVYYSGDLVAKGNLTKNVAAVKSKTDLLPDGFRVVQAQNCHRIASHPADNILPAQNSPCKGNFSGLWWDHGVDLLKADNLEFFKAYKSAGGKPIDGVVLDPEISLEAWSLFLNTCSNPEQSECCLAKMNAIQNDRRFPPVLAALEKLGFAVEKSKPHYLHDALIPYATADGAYTSNLAIWEGYSNTLSSAMYDAAVTAPVKSMYPNAAVNNYGSMTTDQQHCLPDQSGYTPCRYPGGGLASIVGNQQAPCMYVWMSNASVAAGLARVNLTAPGTPFPLTGFNGLLMGVNLMRMNVLSSMYPVRPWVAYKNDTNMSPFQWLKPLANTDFYQEHILHLAMHNPQNMLYFNPCWAKGYCDVSWEDNLLFANLFHELTEVAGCTWESRKWVTAPFTNFSDTVVASGLELPGDTTLWRVTAIDGKTESYVKKSVGAVTVDVPGALAPMVFKGGKSMGPGPNAPAGVWIEAPTTLRTGSGAAR